MFFPFNKLKFGNAQNSNKTIEASLGLGTANAKLRYNTATSKWEFSNDGVTWADFGSGPSLSEGTLWLEGANGFGSTNTRIRRFDTEIKNIGSSMTHSVNASDGSSITINENGVYSFSYCDAIIAQGAAYGLSLNSSSLTTGIWSIPTSQILVLASDLSSGDVDLTNVSIPITYTGAFQAGDIVRPHVENGNVGGTAGFSSYIRASKVASL